MHVSPQRFDLTRTDQNGIQAFKRHVWFNSEVCSNCFSRVRAIGDVVAVEQDVHTHETFAFYERTEQGSQEHTPFDENKRYGTCFCENCGADTRPTHRDLAWERMREYAVNLFEYVRDHTPLTIDRERFARQLALHRLERAETAGKESQIFAVAFARSLIDDVNTTGRRQAAAKRSEA